MVPEGVSVTASFCLAPMRGVTTRVFRRVHEDLFGGLDRAIAPFIPTVKGTRVKPRLLSDVEPDAASRVVLVPQILGRDEEDILLLVRALVDLGYEELNWNLGCPWPQVVKRGRGSGLLGQPDRVCSVLDRVFAAGVPGFSVKVRLGLVDATEIEALLPRLDAYPLREVIIHPRTARQMYEGTADVDAFERCLEWTRHVVCYNGDLFSAADYERLRCRFPSVKRWMLGRGVVRDPWLALRVRGSGLPATGEAYREQLNSFHDELYRRYRAVLFGPSPVLGKMKEWWSYACCLFERPERVFKQVRRSVTLEQYERRVRGVLCDEPLGSVCHG